MLDGKQMENIRDYFIVIILMHNFTLRYCRPEVKMPSSQAIQGYRNGGSVPLLRQWITIDFSALKSGLLKGPSCLGPALRYERQNW